MSPGPWSDLTRPPLRAEALREALLRPDGVWRALEVLEDTGSTNADVSARARGGEAEGYVLLADHQSAGRGRLTRGWSAPPRSSLACSVLLRPSLARERADGVWPPVEPAQWSWIGLLAGLAVVDTLTRICSLPARLKWPNDVLVPTPEGEDGAAPGLRKVCGVLSEAVVTRDALGDSAAAAVVGAGLNVTQGQDELPVPTATSLRLAGSALLDRDTVARGYLRALETRYAAWRRHAGDPIASGLAAAYRVACATIDRDVRVELPGRGAVEGHVVGVDDEGRLIVEEPVGTPSSGRRHTLSAGDVVHVRVADGTLG
jgi:BirA family biotin operon repressor/biotin-[acetyl-CoA-carboxylase] ligase